MVRMFVRHMVKDFRVWKKGYVQFDKERQSMGVKAQTVYRSIDKAGEVTVTHDFLNVRAARAFVGSPRLREVMKAAGVKGKPAIWFTKAA